MKTKLLFTLLLFLTFLSTQAQQRIIGGNNTTIEANPWQISIRGTNNHHQVGLRNQHFCGGAIVARNWILTAAHCVTNFNNNTTIGINEITTSAGITLRNDLATGQYRNVAQIIRHPNYNANTQENDVALIRLTVNLNYNARVQPIQLANSSALASVGRIARVTGWGNTLDGTPNTPSNELQTLDLPIISRTQANNLNTGSVNVSNNMIPLLSS